MACRRGHGTMWYSKRGSSCYIFPGIALRRVRDESLFRVSTSVFLSRIPPYLTPAVLTSFCLSSCQLEKKRSCRGQLRFKHLVCTHVAGAHGACQNAVSWRHLHRTWTTMQVSHCEPVRLLHVVTSVIKTSCVDTHAGTQ